MMVHSKESPWENDPASASRAKFDLKFLFSVLSVCC